MILAKIAKSAKKTSRRRFVHRCLKLRPAKTPR